MYLTLYPLFVLCTVSSTVSPLSVSTLHCTIYLFCVTLSSAVLYRPSSVSTVHSVCLLSSDCLLHCCINTHCCFTVEAVTNVTLNIQAKKFVLLLPAVKIEPFSTFSAKNCCHPEGTVLLEASRHFPVTPYRSRLQAVKRYCDSEKDGGVAYLLTYSMQQSPS